MSFFKKSLSIQNTAAHVRPRFQSDFIHSLLGEISNGTTIMIEEDKNTTHSYTFIKTFIAQNIHQDIVVISKDYDKIKIPDYNTVIQKDRDEKLQIAFRYENLKLQNNEKRFDLNKEMNVSDKNIKFVKLDKNKNCVLDILNKLAPNTIVVLPSFLSPVWHINNLSYIYDIKQIVKRNKLALVATIPTFLYNDTAKLYFDIILSLQTFPFTNKLANYSGIIELKKVYNLDKCKEHTFDALKYGYYATKHGLEFEDISLPPDENELNGCSVGSMF